MRYSLIVFIIVLDSMQLSAQIDTLDEQLSRKEASVETVNWLLGAIKNLDTTDPLMLERYAKKALLMAEDIDYQKGMAYGHQLIGMSAEIRNEYEQAVREYLLAYDKLNQIDEELAAARVSVNIGNVYDMLNNMALAKSYMQGAITVIERLGNEATLNQALLNLGVVYFNEEQYDSSEYYFDMVRNYRESIDDRSGLAIIHLNLANVYEIQGEMEQAKNAYFLAKEYVDPNDLLLSNIYCGIGNILLLLTNDRQGLEYLDSCRQIAIDNDLAYEEMTAVNYYREHYERLGDLTAAYPYLLEEYQMEGDIRGEQVQKEVEVMRLQYDSEKKARELAELSAERVEQENYLLVVGGGLVLITLIASITIILLRIRVRYEQRKTQLIQQELDHKTQELTSYTLNFIQKNELLAELTEKVNQLKSSSDVKATSADKGLTQLGNLIQNSMRIDQDWENFRRMFEDIHPDFNYRLKTAYPDLGNAELKLCALLRLNLNLKESSKILGISSDSVKTARSRLRKKLGLSTEENLVDFLIKFDGKAPAAMMN